MNDRQFRRKSSFPKLLAGVLLGVGWDNKYLLLGLISGKICQDWVRLTVRGRVEMEMSPYNLNKARITGTA